MKDAIVNPRRFDGNSCPEQSVRATVFSTFGSRLCGEETPLLSSHPLFT
jgi:hypothetical protein